MAQAKRRDEEALEQQLASAAEYDFQMGGGFGSTRGSRARRPAPSSAISACWSADGAQGEQGERGEWMALAIEAGRGSGRPTADAETERPLRQLASASSAVGTRDWSGALEGILGFLMEVSEPSCECDFSYTCRCFQGDGGWWQGVVTVLGHHEVAGHLCRDRQAAEYSAMQMAFRCLAENTHKVYKYFSSAWCIQRKVVQCSACM